MMFVLPVVVLLAIIVGFAVVAISKMSGLTTEVQVAQKQAEEAQKAVEERDQKLREARAEVSVLGSAGQGAAVLAAAERGSGVSGLALVHPEQNALNLYAYNLPPAPEGQEYRVIIRDAGGGEKDVAAVAPNERGEGFVIARDVPEGAAHVELALVPKGAQQAQPRQGQGQNGQAQAGGAQPAPAQQATRKPVLAGDLPKPGEAGVTTPQPSDDGPPARQAQARRGRR
ncbi:MAG: hypothetical protein ACJ79R_17725 [Anaeromyxobacteraceae bacterium]